VEVHIPVNPDRIAAISANYRDSSQEISAFADNVGLFLFYPFYLSAKRLNGRRKKKSPTCGHAGLFFFA